MHDLREIRLAHGVSVADIHRESKIPVSLIESFEETGLFDHTMFNRVYLRSFVRTYADAIGVPPEAALASLEEALDGTYGRALAVEYLGLSPSDLDAEGADALVVTEPDVLEQEAEAEEQGPPAADLSGADPARRVAAPSDAYAETEEHRIAPAAEPVDMDWTSQSPPPGGRRPRPPRRKQGGGAPWAYAALGVVLVGAIVWFAMTRGGDRPIADPRADTVADTAAVAVAPVAPETPRPVVLGDTIQVTIASADSQLVQDIKVTVDDDLRRPYWLEAGERRVFNPRERIVIERELDKIHLLVEGRRYPTDRADDQGRLVITRDAAQDFLSSPQ